MLNENIKNARKAKGLSQEELAIKLNVVRQTISKWEKGSSAPDSDMLLRIAEELDTTVGVLLDEAVVYDSKTELEILNAKLEILNEQFAQKSENTRKNCHTVFCVTAILSSCIFVYRALSIAVAYSMIDNEYMSIFSIAQSLFMSFFATIISFVGLYRTRRNDIEDKINLKNKCYLQQIGIFILNFLPLLCCALFRGGFIADILALILMFLPLYFNYKYTRTLFRLVIYDIILIISTSATMHLLSQLYIRYVTGEYDYGTILLGNIAVITSLVVTGIVSAVTVILKTIATKGKTKERT